MEDLIESGPAAKPTKARTGEFVAIFHTFKMTETLRDRVRTCALMEKESEVSLARRALLVEVERLENRRYRSARIDTIATDILWAIKAIERTYWVGVV